MDKILMIAGEASGDMLGAHLYKAMCTQKNTIECFGMGGRLMQEAGVNIIVNSDALGVVGGVEVIKQFKKIHHAYKIIKNVIQQQKPNLVILIDYPGFNLRIAKLAKKLGCKVFYYVSPQIWAWRYHRIHHIKKYVDHMAVLFAFEEKIYQNVNISVSFVGHPITDIALPTLDKHTAMEQFHLTPDAPIIGLFPGSRKQEISRMLPVIVAATPLIKKMIPNAQFILPLANSLTPKDIEPWLSSDIKVIENNTYNALQTMDAAIAVSGTVTLEIAIHKVPMLVIYKMSSFSFQLAKRLIKVPHIALCNLVGEDRIVQEFIQNDVHPEVIAHEIIQLITQQNYRQSMIKKFDVVIHNLGRNGASGRAAQAALALLHS